MLTICASMLCYRRYRLPETPLGWALFLTGCALFIVGSNDKLLSKVFYAESLKNGLKLALKVIGFIVIIAAGIADAKAERG